MAPADVQPSSPPAVIELPADAPVADKPFALEPVLRVPPPELLRDYPDHGEIADLVAAEQAKLKALRDARDAAYAQARDLEAKLAQAEHDHRAFVTALPSPRAPVSPSLFQVKF